MGDLPSEKGWSLSRLRARRGRGRRRRKREEEKEEATKLHLSLASEFNLPQLQSAGSILRASAFSSGSPFSFNKIDVFSRNFRLFCKKNTKKVDYDLKIAVAVFKADKMSQNNTVTSRFCDTFVHVRKVVTHVSCRH